MDKKFHLNIKKEDYSDKIILVGDPDRAKLIAKQYLSNSKLIVKGRGFNAYTGYYKTNKITIQTSGIGTPSTAIILEELLYQHKIKTIIRIGSCCFIDDKKLGDIIFVKSTLINDGTTKYYTNNSIKTISANKLVNRTIIKNSKNLEGREITTVDTFYNPYLLRDIKRWKKKKISAVEMESSILFYFGKKYNIKTGSILIGIDKLKIQNNKISHSILDKNKFRQSIKKAVYTALETIIQL